MTKRSFPLFRATAWETPAALRAGKDLFVFGGCGAPYALGLCSPRAASQISFTQVW